MQTKYVPKQKFRYLKLSPEILIGNKIVNEEYFKKIDSIENSILDGEDFDSLTSDYKNVIKNVSFVNSERINIRKTADIDGVLNQKTLSIEEGAQLKIKTETYK